MREERVGSYQEIEEGKDTRDAAASLSTTVHTPRSLKALMPQSNQLQSGSSSLRQSP